jgi:hypothetical protein
MWIQTSRRDFPSLGDRIQEYIKSSDITQAIKYVSGAHSIRTGTVSVCTEQSIIDGIMFVSGLKEWIFL